MGQTVSSRLPTLLAAVACIPALHHPPPRPQHRGLDAQFARDLRQWSAAALQQGDRLTLELRREFPPRLAHHPPSSSNRSVSEVSTDAGEDHKARYIAADTVSLCDVIER
jgi:hypothetical protein